jgi:uncharacterized membrane protein
MARTPASIGHHPIHPMLVPLPIGLWIFSLIADITFVRGWGGPAWHDMAFYTMFGGVIGALLAALPGFVDYVAVLRRSRHSSTPKVATVHMGLNLTIVVLYVVNLYLRTSMPPTARVPLWLSVVAIALLGVSGWLGGSLAYVHRVGVAEPEAEAPMSIAVEVGTPAAPRRHTGR